jgi:HK97 family phage major capsid protein
VERLKQLLAQLKEVDTKLDAILDAAGDNDLSAEQKAEHDKLLADREKIKKAVADQQARLAREDERVKAEREAEAAEARRSAIVVPGTNRKTTADEPNPADVPGERQKPKLFTPRMQGALKNFKGTKNGKSAEERAYRFGMWARSVLSKQLGQKRPGYKSAYAEEWVAKNMDAATSKDGSGHGYLIPEEFSSDIIDLREQYGVVRRLFDNYPMMSDTLTVPKRIGGVTAYFVAEDQPGTESKMTWGQVRLTARKLMVLSAITNEVNDDAIINWGDRIAGEIAYAFALKEDQCGFLGDGTSTYGGIVGMVTKLQDVDGAGTDSAGLTTGSGATWSALVLGDFYSMMAKLPAYAMSRDPRWVVSTAFFWGKMTPLLTALGGTTPAEAGPGPGRPMFLGFPVEYSQVLPAASASGSVVALFGDFKLAAAFGDRSTDDVEFSDEATVGGRSMWERDELGVRGKERFDINVHDVGDATTAGPVVGLQTA